MPKRKTPKKLTNDQLAKRVFHPDVIEHVKKHIASETKPAKRSSKTTLQES